MALIGNIIHRGLRLRNRMNFRTLSPAKYQENELRRLLKKARYTAFGKHFQFMEILRSQHIAKTFKNKVPVYDYEKMYFEWWHRALKEEPDVSWPGYVQYFALTSGTSGAASKKIPVTNDMVRAIRQNSIKQIFALAAFNPPDEVFEKSILILGGSTHLNKTGRYFEGDLSGISASRLPFWFQHYYKPGPKISAEKDWNTKISEIVKMAPQWDISIVAGIPSWVQILFEKIIEHYQVDNIHQIWPNLVFYIHGGVNFAPYRRSFDRLTGKPLRYMETYIASEGYIAFQRSPESNSMQMILNNGIYYEFVPFNSQNFDQDGEINENAEVLTMDEVEPNKPYALLMSTSAGAWRYLIGDVIRFTDTEKAQIIVDGRTKHFLSLCGEHLSVDNMNRAVEELEKETGIDVQEFTVAGEANLNMFAHHWYIGVKEKADEEKLKKILDDNLKKLNDDYRLERASALNKIKLTLLPPEYFYQWMESKGKMGGQNKFPRVLKGSNLASWESFIGKKMPSHL